MAAEGTKPTVGVIGLGKMGRPMARNLIKAGFRTVVHNRSRPAVDELVAEGAEDGGSARGVIEAADVIVTSLPDPSAVRAVFLDQDKVIEAVRPGQIFLDTSTVDPELSRDLATAIAERGGAFLDAPVSGGTAGAEAGTLTIMVGGDKEAFERAKPVMEALGQKLHHVGPSGSGTVVKLANQLLVGINMAAVAEALVLGVKAGADPNVMLDVLSSSFGSSRMLERGVPLIVQRNFDGGTPVDLLRKDLGLIASLAEQLSVPLDCGNTARQVFDRAHDANYGTADMTAIIRPMEDDAGIEVAASAPTS